MMLQQVINVIRHISQVLIGREVSALNAFQHCSDMDTEMMQKTSWKDITTNTEVLFTVSEKRCIHDTMQQEK